MRNKTVYLPDAHIWAMQKPTKQNPDRIDIHIALGSKRITTVNNISGERCHPHLFSHLQAILKRDGKWPTS
jgi:glucosamine 6-phosphate synthetase-like amidotransferase/phosphosugar isomerase protein